MLQHPIFTLVGFMINIQSVACKAVTAWTHADIHTTTLYLLQNKLCVSFLKDIARDSNIQHCQSQSTFFAYLLHKSFLHHCLPKTNTGENDVQTLLNDYNIQI